MFVFSAGLLAIGFGRRGIADDTGAPKIAFDEKEYLFPTAFVGSKVTHSFHFTNRGTAELVIQKVDTSCGCTVSRIARAHVPPGEDGTIELTLDTTEKLGHAVLVRGTVHSNDPKENAAGPGTTLLELKGQVVTCYRLMPLGAYFGEVVRSNGPKTVEIKAPGVLAAADGYKITAVECPVRWLKVETRALDAGELPKDSKGGHALKLTVLPTIPVGNFMVQLIVRTDCPTQPAFRIPVIGVAAGAIKGPETIVFTPFHRGEPVERVGFLQRVDGKPGGIPIVSIEHDTARFDVKAEPTIEGARTELKITVKKDAPPGPFASPIVVHLNETATPLVRIETYGEILPRVAPDPALGLLRPGGEPVRILVPIDGGKLVGARVDPAEAPFEATVEPANESGAATVVVKLKDSASAGAHGSLVLDTDVPGEEQVRVPLEVLARP
jgi:hypothetical protein